MKFSKFVLQTFVLINIELPKWPRKINFNLEPWGTDSRISVCTKKTNFHKFVEQPTI